jgi:hypothetical protein
VAAAPCPRFIPVTARDSRRVITNDSIRREGAVFLLACVRPFSESAAIAGSALAEVYAAYPAMAALCIDFPAALHHTLETYYTGLRRVTDP